MAAVQIQDEAFTVHPCLRGTRVRMRETRQGRASLLAWGGGSGAWQASVSGVPCGWVYHVCRITHHECSTHSGVPSHVFCHCCFFFFFFPKRKAANTAKLFDSVLKETKHQYCRVKSRSCGLGIGGPGPHPSSPFGCLSGMLLSFPDDVCISGKKRCFGSGMSMSQCEYVLSLLACALNG